MATLRSSPRRVAIVVNLPSQLVSARLDGHACAVKPLREEHVLTAQTVVGRSELQLREAERVSQVQQPVHVGVREIPEELLPPIGAWRRRRRLEHALRLPPPLRLRLQPQQQVAPRRPLPRLLAPPGGRGRHPRPPPARVPGPPLPPAP